jgi:hypothetical protein
MKMAAMNQGLLEVPVLVLEFLTLLKILFFSSLEYDFLTSSLMTISL